MLVWRRRPVSAEEPGKTMNELLVPATVLFVQFPFEIIQQQFVLILYNKYMQPARLRGGAGCRELKVESRSFKLHLKRPITSSCQDHSWRLPDDGHRHVDGEGQGALPGLVAQDVCAGGHVLSHVPDGEGHVEQIRVGNQVIQRFKPEEDLDSPLFLLYLLHSKRSRTDTEWNCGNWADGEVWRVGDGKLKLIALALVAQMEASEVGKAIDDRCL